MRKYLFLSHASGWLACLWCWQMTRWVLTHKQQLQFSSVGRRLHWIPLWRFLYPQGHRVLHVMTGSKISWRYSKTSYLQEKRQKSESVLLFISLPHPMFWFHKLTILIKDDRDVLWKHKYNIIHLDTELLPLSISERPAPLLNIFQHLEGKTRWSLLKKTESGKKKS